MKHLMFTAFCGLLFISSCQCNDDGNTADTTMTDTMVIVENEAPAAEGQPANDADMSNERFRRMFNLSGYTEEQVKEYRKMHDEMDWGAVPGYYPEASTRPLTEADTRYLTKWGHSVMLNEIYARHGMTFSDPDLNEHFGSFGWYNAKSANVDAELTALERENIAFLNSHPAQ